MKGYESIGEIGYDLKGSLEMAKYCDFFLRLKENGELLDKKIKLKLYLFLKK